MAVQACSGTSLDAPGLSSADTLDFSKTALGFVESTEAPPMDHSMLAPWNNQQQHTFNIDSLGIPGIDLPGPSSVAQWPGSYQENNFTYPSSSYPTSGAAPGPRVTPIIGHDDSTRPWEECNPLVTVQAANWCHPPDLFTQGLGSLYPTGNPMTSVWPCAGRLWPSTEVAGEQASGVDN